MSDDAENTHVRERYLRDAEFHRRVDLVFRLLASDGHMYAWARESPIETIAIILDAQDRMSAEYERTGVLLCRWLDVRAVDGKQA